MLNRRGRLRAYNRFRNKPESYIVTIIQIKIAPIQGLRIELQITRVFIKTNVVPSRLEG